MPGGASRGLDKYVPCEAPPGYFWFYYKEEERKAVRGGNEAPKAAGQTRSL